MKLSPSERLYVKLLLSSSSIMEDRAVVLVLKDECFVNEHTSECYPSPCFSVPHRDDNRRENQIDAI
jgi:hypothetical protein